jgi:sugar phosphate isomerase/epimerase
MTAPLGVQLYSVRESMSQDFDGTVREIAKMGYTGVEPAGFPEGVTPGQAKKLFDELGLTVTSAHSPMPLGENKQKVLDTMAAIACPHLVCPWIDPVYFSSKEKMKELAEILNQANEIAIENGMKFSYHNHDFEYALLDGSPAIYTLEEYLNNSIGFELDTYWIHVAGQDPAKVTARFGERSPLLHIKDGPGNRKSDMTAVGDGVVDVPAIIRAGEPHTEWLIVELDRCATDMMDAVAKSYKYLAGIAKE